jgi:hypothetical protein
VAIRLKSVESILDAPAQLVEVVVEVEWLLPVAFVRNDGCYHVYGARNAIRRCQTLCECMNLFAGQKLAFVYFEDELDDRRPSCSPKMRRGASLRRQAAGVGAEVVIA